MSRIKGKNTKPEMLVRKFLFSHGLRYKLYDKTLPGKPDLVFPKYKAVVFIHGCFWHGHTDCKYFVVPQTRREWWQNKIDGNKLKDDLNTIKLKSLGWRVITVFECELKPGIKEITLNHLIEKVRDDHSCH